MMPIPFLSAFSQQGPAVGGYSASATGELLDKGRETFGDPLKDADSKVVKPIINLTGVSMHCNHLSTSINYQPDNDLSSRIGVCIILTDIYD